MDYLHLMASRIYRNYNIVIFLNYRFITFLTFLCFPIVDLILIVDNQSDNEFHTIFCHRT
jgi:hypothetical protein